MICKCRLFPCCRRRRAKRCCSSRTSWIPPALYNTLAAGEPDRRLAEVYRRLAASERRHADHWTAKLHDAGVSVPAFRPSWRTRVLMWLARRFGAATVISVIANQEQADARKYAVVADRAAGMDTDEVGHAARAPRDRRGRAAPKARSSPSSRGGIDPRPEMPCAPRCSAPTTGWCPT